ncbi:MAG: winged helix-turn-helix domain-containing protein [Candidatus Beckwithbacteria bacterium]
MDTLPKTTFTKSPATEAERIIQTSIQVANGFYKDKGFLVLPDPKHNNATEVILPNLKYHQIKNYWQTLQPLISQFPTKAPKLFYSTIQKQLLLLNLYQPLKNSKALISDWQQIQSKFWKYLDLLLPHQTKNIKTIKVHPTNFGSIASWWLNKENFICYLRTDASISHLAEAIITTLIRLNKNYQYSWENSEAIVDFFLTHSFISPLLNNYQPTQPSLLKTNLSLRKKSDLYLQSLGVTYKQKLLQLHNHQILFKGKKINHLFTKNQQKILKFLIKNQNELISSDNLADELWGKENFKSLWALNKTIQRLRLKLQSLGFPSKNLKVLRGRGYLLLP